MSPMPPSLARAVAARRTDPGPGPRRTRYLIRRDWLRLGPGRSYLWRALAAPIPTAYDGRPLRDISQAAVDLDAVEFSGGVSTWDEAAAWCDAHHRGLV